MAFPIRAFLMAHAAHFGGKLTLEVQLGVQSTVLLINGSGEPTCCEDDRVFAAAMVQEAVLLA
eukprot:CAMPEP_0119063922 /NCGR_PEP_ID=MMETSP1178-20130426/7135_1 /TAXON_ID=33656 /ORGANISM="unid sp, Strain CCMP2000" /LENGTH=62 /DNA_ID=CAMNT_0007045315 /DNA_START=282 /DNA_END=470 /DNA_ORIENTATION=-